MVDGVQLTGVGVQLVHGSETAGTVTSVSVVTANGISGTVATSTTTPAITLALAAITPTSVNKVTITPPAASATLTIANGKTATINNTLTFAGTDGSTLNVGAGGTLGSAATQNTGTSGATIPLLNGANTFSAAQTFTQSVTMSGLPMADPHVVGGLWLSAGVLTVSAG